MSPVELRVNGLCVWELVYMPFEREKSLCTGFSQRAQGHTTLKLLHPAAGGKAAARLNDLGSFLQKS